MPTTTSKKPLKARTTVKKATTTKNTGTSKKTSKKKADTVKKANTVSKAAFNRALKEIKYLEGILSQVYELNDELRDILNYSNGHEHTLQISNLTMLYAKHNKSLLESFKKKSKTLF